jgi:hypothetical protein
MSLPQNRCLRPLNPPPHGSCTITVDTNTAPKAKNKLTYKNTQAFNESVKGEKEREKNPSSIHRQVDKHDLHAA